MATSFDFTLDDIGDLYDAVDEATDSLYHYVYEVGVEEGIERGPYVRKLERWNVLRAKLAEMQSALYSAIQDDREAELGRQE